MRTAHEVQDRYAVGDRLASQFLLCLDRRSSDFRFVYQVIHGCVQGLAQ